MVSLIFRRVLFIQVAVVVLAAFASAAEPYDQCRILVEGIIAGTATYNNLTNETFWDSPFWYSGPVPGLNPEYPRWQFITLTKAGKSIWCTHSALALLLTKRRQKGCDELCQPVVQYNEASTGLALTATWVFPLTILLALPYDSLHKRKFSDTMVTALNWLGSPQTALTATIFNFRNIRDCHRHCRADKNLDPTWNDIFYVLSVFNQFDIPVHDKNAKEFITMLMYGLFRPVSKNTPGFAGRDDRRMTAELLNELAMALRMLRRRGVIPTLSSLGTFLVAFVISVVLSFADVRGSTVNFLVLGLMFGWLPILVVFTIVDRNPVSSGRSAELMSRWLYNTRAIWNARDGAKVTWWRSGQDTQSPEATFPLCVGDFIGQGRQIQYCGILPAVLEVVCSDCGNQQSSYFRFTETKKVYKNCASLVLSNLSGIRPISWYATAVVSLLLVWTHLLMAFVAAYTTPTVGLGCWSGSFLVYGILSSISWVVHLGSKRPGKLLRGFCHFSNFAALTFLFIFVVLVLSGGLNTCVCMTNFGNYMNFENAGFFQEHCYVLKYWIPATVVGGLIPVSSFVVAVFWWLKCQHLWQANERGVRSSWQGQDEDEDYIGWSWLRYA